MTTATIVADPPAIAAVIAQHPEQARAIVAGLVQAVGISAVLASIAELTRDVKPSVRKPIVFLPKPARRAIVALPNYTVQQRFERWARDAIRDLPEAERPAAIVRVWTEGLERSAKLSPPMTAAETTTIRTALYELGGSSPAETMPAPAPSPAPDASAAPAPTSVSSSKTTRPRGARKAAVATKTMEIAGPPVPKAKARRRAS